MSSSSDNSNNSSTLLLTYVQAATELCVVAMTIRRLVDKGDIPQVRIGGRVRILRTDLEDYVAKQRHRVPDVPRTTPNPSIYLNGKRPVGRPRKPPVPAQGLRKHD
jgi:excisionase family DNA binding protein